MFDRYSCILYGSMENPVEDAWKIMQKVAFTALYRPVDTILFFALCDVIPCEM